MINLSFYDDLSSMIQFIDKIDELEKKYIAIENCQHIRSLNLKNDIIPSIIGMENYTIIKSCDTDKVSQEVLAELLYSVTKLGSITAAVGKQGVDLARLKSACSKELKSCELTYMKIDQALDHRCTDTLTVKLMGQDLSTHEMSDNYSKAYDLIKQGLGEKNNSKIQEAFALIRKNTELTEKEIRFNEFDNEVSNLSKKIIGSTIDVIGELNADKLSRQYLGRMCIDENDKYTTDVPEKMRWASIRRIQMYIVSRMKMSFMSFRTELMKIANKYKDQLPSTLQLFNPLNS